MMNRQRLILSIVFLIISVGLIAGINHYYLQPRVLLTMPGVEKINLPGTRRASSKPDLYAGTMEEILKGKKKISISSSEPWTRRNPFLWPEELAVAEPGIKIAVLDNSKGDAEASSSISDESSSTAGETAREMLAPELNLSMVIVGETRNLALVNNNFVTEGSRISGYYVVKIDPGTILLACKDKTRQLTLEPSVGPLEHHVSKQKKDTKKAASVSQINSTLNFKTQLKEVLELYSNPSIQLND